MIWTIYIYDISFGEYTVPVATFVAYIQIKNTNNHTWYIHLPDCSGFEKPLVHACSGMNRKSQIRVCNFCLTASSKFLVGAFNPFEKYLSNWIISPGRDENKKCLKPPPRNGCFLFVFAKSTPKPQDFLGFSFAKKMLSSNNFVSKYAKVSN